MNEPAKQMGEPRRPTRFGLYLGDLRRSTNDSHGIVNYALGLACTLPEMLAQDEELIVFVGEEVAPEVRDPELANVQIVHMRSPNGIASRLWMDHVSCQREAYKRNISVMHFPKGYIPALRWPATKVIATVHDDIPLRYLQAARGRMRPHRAYFAWSLMHSLRRADRIITDSHFSAERLSQHVEGVSDRLSVVFLASSLPPLDPVPQHAKPRVMVHFGSRHPHKRSAEGISWTKKFLDQNQQYGLIVTGQLTDEAECLCAHPAIRRERSPLSSEQIACLLRDSRCLLFFSSMEGFGLPPVEAVSLGTAAVWARSDAVPEVMAGAPGGFSVGDELSFRSALDEVLRLDDGQITEMRVQFCNRYSMQATAAATLCAYRSVSMPWAVPA